MNLILTVTAGVLLASLAPAQTFFQYPLFTDNGGADRPLPRNTLIMRTASPEERIL